MKEMLNYNSNGKGQICATAWLPQGPVCAVVQIVHGIAEHMGRYEEFALHLNAHGIAVVGEDHMGHGESCGAADFPGYFHGGWFAAVQDCVSLMELMKQRYPGVPYILFGHSMGSFMARTVLARYPECALAGCVICGTGWQNPLVLRAGIALCRNACKNGGDKQPKASLQNLVFGGYNKRVEHPKTPNDWLSRDAARVADYQRDPKCGFAVTAGLMRDMLQGIRYIQDGAHLDAMNKDLPCFFIAGAEDPVGAYGKGVVKTARQFEKHGMKNVQTKLYPLCRHEILNEINRADVYADVVAFIKKVCADSPVKV